MFNIILNILKQKQTLGPLGNCTNDTFDCLQSSIYGKNPFMGFLQVNFNDLQLCSRIRYHTYFPKASINVNSDGF